MKDLLIYLYKNLITPEHLAKIGVFGYTVVMIIAASPDLITDIIPEHSQKFVTAICRLLSAVFMAMGIAGSIRRSRQNDPETIKAAEEKKKIEGNHV